MDKDLRLLLGAIASYLAILIGAALICAISLLLPGPMSVVVGFLLASAFMSLAGEKQTEYLLGED